MTDDYLVRGRSNQSLVEEARRVAKEYTDEKGWVDIVGLVTSGHVETVFGPKRLILELRPDRSMDGKDGFTSFSPRVVTITLRETVFSLAKEGEGRSRQTLAHELGHAVLHNGAPKARATGAVGSTPSWIRPFESAEHQAKVFAAACLIDPRRAANALSAAALADACGVSLRSAEIAYEQYVSGPAEKAKSFARIDQLVASLRNNGPANSRRTAALGEPCPVCSERALTPFGNKHSCLNCGFTRDQFQDGDTVG